MFAAPSIADPVPNSRGLVRGPYRIIRRGPVCQAREIAMEWCRKAAARLRWLRIIQLWRMGVRQTANVMWTARVVLASVLGGIAVLVGVLQVGALIAARRQSRSYSLVPFVGASLGVIACFVAPWRNALYAIPVFLALDPTPVMFAVMAVRGRLFK